MGWSRIFESIKLDRYYKIISPAGIIFLILGLYFNYPDIKDFGILTFIYGLWAWMIGTVFHLKGNIRYKKPRNFAYLISFIITLSFVIYVFLAYKILQ